MKIAIISHVLDFSGVPIAQIRLSKAMADRGHRVDLYFLGRGTRYPSIDNISGRRVSISNYGSTLRAVTYLAATLTKGNYSYVFVAEDHLGILITLLATLLFVKSRIIVSSRVQPYDAQSIYPNASLFSKSGITRLLYRLLSSKIFLMTAVSNDLASTYRKLFSWSTHVGLYNIISDSFAPSHLTEFSPQKNRLRDPKFTVVACSRLDYEKGIHMIIRSFSLFRRTCPTATLLIVGEGKEEANLRNLTALLCLEDSVTFVGHTDDPRSHFRNARIYVHASLNEGMPNTLVEAILCGCIPVAYDCDTGPREILYCDQSLLVSDFNEHHFAKAMLVALEYHSDSHHALFKRTFKLFSSTEVIAKLNEYTLAPF
jgi:glycosyltransferase involved in cell wall biosynthesis